MRAGQPAIHIVPLLPAPLTPLHANASGRGTAGAGVVHLQSIMADRDAAYPGITDYDAALAALKTRRGADNDSCPSYRFVHGPSNYVMAPACHSCPASYRVALTPDACHNALFHGKLRHDCLARRGLSAAQLPCVRELLITGFTGSGTTSVADGIGACHESHWLECGVLVSWLSRTDVWRLGANFSSGFGLDGEVIMRHYNARPSPGIGKKVNLSRCLYRTVLLQTREPLSTIRSAMSLFCRQTGYDVMRDQLLARSRSSVLARCGLPMAPTGGKVCARPSDMERPATRWPFVGYYVRSWWMWMAAALEAADGHFAVEKANASAILRMGGVARGRAHSPCGGGGCVRRNIHGSMATTTPQVTWEEARRADPVGARGAFDLATRLFGYAYQEHEVPAEWREGRAGGKSRAALRAPALHSRPTITVTRVGSTGIKL